MLSFIARRLGLLIPTFFGVTLLTFALIRLIPGDPVEVMMGERRVDPQMHAEALHRLGLDKPLYQQYLDYVGNLAQGNLGESLTTREGVWHEFLTLFPATLELSLAAMLFAGTFGLLAGVIAALKRGSLFDHGVMTVSLAGYSMPIFWWGLILIMLFSVSLGWTPVSGRLDLLYDIEPKTGFMLIDTLLSDEQGSFLDAVRHLILPAIVLGTIPLAVIARMTRSAMLEVLREDYVRTARAKGLSPAGGLRARPAQRADSGADGIRPAGRHAARRRGADRNHLLLAGHRQVADRRHQPSRLPGGAERHPAGRHPGHPGQFRRGHPLRPGQPAHSPPTLRSQPMNAMHNAPASDPSLVYPSPLKEFWQSFAHNKGALGGLLFMLLIVFCALFAPWVAPYDPSEQFRDFLLTPPSWLEGGQARFLLGTDELGRDLLSRLIHGARLSLLIGLSSVVISLIPGILLGLLAGFSPNRAGPLIMRLMDIMLALPSLLLAVAIVAILGRA